MRTKTSIKLTYKYHLSHLYGPIVTFVIRWPPSWIFMTPQKCGDTKQGRLESTSEIMQNKHVKVLHYFVDDIK
jgi:hypothetical protein